MKRTYAIVDLETTGSSFNRGDRIIQFGCTLLQEDKIVQEMNITINPGRKIPAVIEKLTGITNQDVKDAPYFDDVCDFIFNTLEDCIFVAHNVHFDYHFLNSSFSELGRAPLNLRAMDTVELTKILFPTLSSYRLGDLSSLFQLNHSHAHDAASDAHATAELFLLLKEKAVHLPLVTLEKLNILSEFCQMNNSSFFYDCYEEAKEMRLPLGKHVYVKNGIALREKERISEQTAYRQKNVADFMKASQQILQEQGFQNRPDQLRMMGAVSDFMDEPPEENLAIEAAAGIGKTLAYLLPVAFHATPENKVVISTSTLLLQEQILDKEMHQLKRMLPFELLVSSLKSKGNLIHLEKIAKLQLDTLAKKESLVMMSIFVWLTETLTGDINELSQSHTVDLLGQKLTYSSQDAPLTGVWEQDDFYASNNRKAEKASIIVTNHAFLSHHIQDIAFLQSANNMTLLLDEAHQFPRIFQESLKETFELSLLKRRMRRFAMYLRDFREGEEKNRGDNQLLYDLFNFEFAVDQFYQALSDAEELLMESFAADRKGKQGSIYLEREFQAEQRVIKMDKKLKQYVSEVIFSGERCLVNTGALDDPMLGLRGQSLLKETESVKRMLDDFLSDDETIYYVLICTWENDVLSLKIEKNYLRSSEKIRQLLHDSFGKIIYVSSSLRVDGTFAYFKEKVGEPSLRELTYASPYNLAERLKIFVPADISAITSLEDKEAAKQIVQMLQQIVLPLQRKALVLFTSNQLLEDVFSALKSQENRAADGPEILAQGFSGSRRRMHNRFTSAATAVLLGSASYWEGVDFADQAVEILVITRLPFEPPYRPESLAFEDYYAKRRKSAFYAEFLPRAMVRLKQGAGRLVRSENARGVILCLDNRLVHSSYNNNIKNALPENVLIEELPSGEISEKMAAFLKK
ncbi:dead/deah box helicase [Trichococcus palustris]|uniref:3'-5' exonuclease DinG n=1 Tax=Trichococcus palustris TaxID=140314 RepID=A0A143YC59_9LACT|nr:helicase C-terminal domain-containing protein [Trichococcus palustris]CZQ84774.1 dead/deah box helicase [Trichococcus palustris]SFK53950.1 ATP-dependent DNA helicase DinG [Trichococcus palustris]